MKPREEERRRPARDGVAADGVVRLYIDTGRGDGVRPQDLVGAITGETGIAGRAIGAIEISDRFSIVEVAGEVAATVIEGLHGATIRGKKVKIRRDVDKAKPKAPRRGPVRTRERRSR